MTTFVKTKGIGVALCSICHNLLEGRVLYREEGGDPKTYFCDWCMGQIIDMEEGDCCRIMCGGHIHINSADEPDRECPDPGCNEILSIPEAILARRRHVKF